MENPKSQTEREPEMGTASKGLPTSIVEDKLVTSAFLALNIFTLSSLSGFETLTPAQSIATLLLVASLPFFAMNSIVLFKRSNGRSLPNTKLSRWANLLSMLATITAFTVLLGKTSMVPSVTFVVCAVFACLIYLSLIHI